MMNSDELIAKEADQVINPESPAEVTAAEDPAAEDQATVDNAAAQAENPAPEEVQMPLFTNKEEVLARAQEIAGSEEGSDRQELDTLKQLFYKFRKAELMAERTAFIEAGGEADAFMPQLDPTEETFKQAMQTIRQRRAEQQAEQDRIKQENLKRKQTIIERIKEMASSPEEANKSYDEFRGLQAEWKEIKAVPAENATELWKNYQLCVEQFYDLLKMNSEMREYDFRKNLEAKTRLCEMAEKLADEPDVISAFNQLQALHQEYKETGPVAKDLREDIWNRFKAASTVINKRHQDHFLALKAREEENLTRKTALCEQVEAIDTAALKSFAEWNTLTDKIIALQAEWKTIGYAPQRMNTQIFERFRAACDNFFQQKAAYFKTVKAELNDNLAKKTALVEKAEALSRTAPNGVLPATPSSSCRRNGRPSVPRPTSIPRLSGSVSSQPATISSRRRTRPRRDSATRRRRTWHTSRPSSNSCRHCWKTPHRTMPHSVCATCRRSGTRWVTCLSARRTTSTRSTARPAMRSTSSSTSLPSHGGSAVSSRA